MALLLAMYQKLKLVREKNQLTLDVANYSSKVTRISKQIERAQKRYTSLFSQLESQAKMMQSQATVYFQQMSGLGTNSVNPYNYNGLNGFVMGVAGNMLKKGGYKYKDADGTEQELGGMSDSDVQKMMAEYQLNAGFIPKKDENGKAIQNEYENGWTPEQVAAFMTAVNTGKMQEMNARTQTQTLSQNYSNNVSIWLEAQRAQLEAEQDAVLEPLNYEETMMELRKTQAETRLQRINSEIQAYDQLVSQEAQNSAPKFGLG